MGDPFRALPRPEARGRFIPLALSTVVLYCEKIQVFKAAILVEDVSME